jgi:inosine-uridine nucleoside N-ribohydrolase
MTTPRKIIIDTDPGVDDALAFFLAVASPQLEIVGITTTFGNLRTPEATRNALRLLEILGRTDIPVCQGSQLPLYLNFDTVKLGYFVYGDDGLGNTNQPAPKHQASSLHAAEFIVQQVLANPHQITLVAIAPLTNLATALALEPRIASLVKEVVIMGGSINAGGNVTPAAEANIINDPHAADRVLTAGWPVTLVGLDATMKVTMTNDYLKALKTDLKSLGNFIWDITRFNVKFYQDIIGINGLCPHDSVALTYLLAPELFTTQQGPVRVPTEGIAMGQTILARRKSDGQTKHAWVGQPPVNVCLDVDAEAVLDLYREKMAYFRS